MSIKSIAVTTVLIVAVLILTIFVLISAKNKSGTDSRQDQEIYTDGLKASIGQMLIVGFRGTEITQGTKIVNDIKNLNLGGIILFDYDQPSKSYQRNIKNPEQLERLTTDLQNITTTPLLISVDAEGGMVNRLKESYGFIKVPSAADLGKGTIENTKKVAFNLANELNALGINTNFAPVVDVNVNPQNPVIGALDRSFSSDPEKVTDYAKAFILAQKAENIINVIKHFPGHGSSKSDSHKGLVDITNTYQEEELIPFKELINQGVVDVVMTAHIMNRNIDPDYPATLSTKFLEDILRDELNFKGVIVSDDMQMKAITDNFGFGDSIIRAINAGCDMLIFSNNIDTYDPDIAQKAVDIIYNAVLDGRIDKDRIIEATNRIKNLKNKYLI